MNRKIINNLYEHFKNTPKKLKIVCDWDEVIQAHEPYALWKASLEEKKLTKEYALIEFSKNFEEFWKLDLIKYSPYGSKLLTNEERSKKGYSPFELSLLEKQQQIKNSSNFYQQAPFLTIAEDLLKLIKEDKVEKLIFLSAYDKKVFPNKDHRKYGIFNETFGELWEYKESGEKVKKFASIHLIGFDTQRKGESKADWIKENASDFDMVIDDNPIICKSLVEIELEKEDDWKRHGKECMGCSDCADAPSKKKIIAPYYPAIENQHDKEVLLVKNEVSKLKKEDFAKKLT